MFDSGLGGLHVLRRIVKTLPQYNYIYLGDTAHMPYGPRSKKDVHNFTASAVDFLFKQGCELIILACHTASSSALRKIQQKYVPRHHPDKKVIGVLIPTAEAAVAETKNKRIGVIATQRTAAAHAFTRELRKLDPDMYVFEKACPLLVPIVERGEHDSKTTIRVLQQYLIPVLTKNIDTLILGCTHYGILEKHIKKITGNSVHIINSAQIVPEKLKIYLNNHPEIEKKFGKSRTLHFYSTKATPHFKNLGGRFFGKNIRIQKAFLP